MTEPREIDRIDRRGNITAHLTSDGKRTLCGITIEQSQRPCDNGMCRRCERLRLPGSAR